jgi:hypothetical protein
MSSNDAVDVAIVRRAALLYARGKWGNVNLDEGVAVAGLEDDAPRCYVFAVGLQSQALDRRHIEGHVSQHAQGFIDSLDVLRRGPQTEQAQWDKYVRARKTLLDPEHYGTIVIRTRKDRHPVMMAYEGIPFVVVGRYALAARRPALKPILLGQRAAAPPRYRVPDGDGYPHFYVDVPEDSGQKLYSLLDCDQVYSKRPPREPRAVAPETVARFRRIWAFVATVSDEYLSKISPEYLEADSGDPYIPGVPDLTWHDGCGPTAAANILAYWDDHGYPALVDEETGKTVGDLIHELVAAMQTDASGNTSDGHVDDGIRAVCNDSAYNNNYDFTIDGPDSWTVWSKIQGAIKASRPCLLIVHGHGTYGDHSMTVVGYRQVVKDCAADDHFVTVHDTWPNGGADVEIPYEGSVSGYDPDWRVVRVTPGMREGDLLWYKHLGQQDGSANWAANNGRRVGSGWGYPRIFGGHDGVIYAVASDGALYWYKHLGFGDGSAGWMHEGTPQGAGRLVGSGWGYPLIFGGCDGVIYGVASDGALYWYKHLGFGDGSARWMYEGTPQGAGRLVGSGWGYPRIFGGRDGVIYGVASDGALYWYKHLGFGDGSARWMYEGTPDGAGRLVGSGWGYPRIFGGHEGVIYGVT